MVQPKISAVETERRGGKREGAGRKPLPSEQKRNRCIYWLTEREAAAVNEFINQLRQPDSWKSQ